MHFDSTTHGEMDIRLAAFVGIYSKKTPPQTALSGIDSIRFDIDALSSSLSPRRIGVM